MKYFFRSYNQHWLIQEAEQRRLAGGSAKPQGVSPSMNQQINNQMNMNQQYQQNNGHHPNNMMMTSPVSHGGEIPASPNHINTQSPVYENSSYVNHQQVSISFYLLILVIKFTAFVSFDVFLFRLTSIILLLAQSPAKQHVYKSSEDSSSPHK